MNVIFSEIFKTKSENFEVKARFVKEFSILPSFLKSNEIYNFINLSILMTFSILVNFYRYLKSYKLNTTKFI